MRPKNKPIEVKIENKKYEFHHKAAQQESCEKEQLGFHEQISGFCNIKFTAMTTCYCMINCLSVKPKMSVQMTKLKSF